MKPTKTLNEFISWLESLPEDTMFCQKGRRRTETCPIAEFTGTPAGYSDYEIRPGEIGEAHWGYTFMHKFDQTAPRRMNNQPGEAHELLPTPVADAIKIAKEIRNAQSQTES